jgi:nicotinamide mononucleotide transporter
MIDTLIAALLTTWQQALGQPAFTLWANPVSWVEVIAFVLALWMVGCNLRVNPLGWPLAIVSSLLYVGLFWQSKLYGDAGLQIMFVALAAWGWWQWLRGHAGDGAALEVRRLETRLRPRLFIATLLAWPALGLFLKRYTDTDVPFWDAFPTAASLTGQWLLGRKYVENWAVWLLVNLVSIALFAYKQLWLTAILYAVFAALSVVGWRAWLRLQAQSVNHAGNTDKADSIDAHAAAAAASIGSPASAA